MGKTIAQALMDKGKAEGKAEGKTEGKAEAALESRRATLIRQLRKRFRAVPAEVSQTIDRTESVSQLDEWLDRFATATRLEEIGFERAK